MELLEMTLCSGTLPCRCYEVLINEWDIAITQLEHECNRAYQGSERAEAFFDDILPVIAELRREINGVTQAVISPSA